MNSWSNGKLDTKKNIKSSIVDFALFTNDRRMEEETIEENIIEKGTTETSYALRIYPWNVETNERTYANDPDTKWIETNS